jgi:ubiquinone/menaquinone biosynthesis C-methylase UbiE
MARRVDPSKLSASMEHKQTIPPDVYDRDYFLSDICEGWDEYQQDKGVSYNKAKQVRALGPRPGLKILDAGCGRGETLLACARAGADVAGVDYSEAAVEITRETLAEYPEADIRVGDVTALPWPDNSFDRVQNSDVIEHLDPPQTVPMLKEFRRVLKPGGFALLHTAPNRLFMDISWPVMRPVLRALGHAEVVKDMEDWFEVAENYHVNEQSVHSLRGAMREAGFEDPRVWIDPDVLRSGNYRYTNSLDGPLVRTATKLAALRPFRLFLGNDVFAVGRKSVG